MTKVPPPNDDAEGEGSARRLLRVAPEAMQRASMIHDLNHFLASAHAHLLNVEADHAGVDLSAAREALSSASALVKSLADEITSPRTARKQPALDAERCFQEVARILSQPGHASLRVRVPSQPVALELSEIELKQILMNLATNALEADARLVVMSLDVPRLASHAILRVTDDGSGMTAAIRARVFEPFLTTKASNQGLGLSGVRATVERYGGRIDVESMEGLGTTFTIRLPIRATSVGLVLVVDKDTRGAQLTARVLERAGYRTLVAHRRGEALRAIELCRGRIDAAIVDANVERDGGLSLVEELQTLSPRVRAIVTSGESVEWNRNTPLLLKPYGADDLLEALRAELHDASSPELPPARTATG